MGDWDVVGVNMVLWRVCIVLLAVGLLGCQQSTAPKAIGTATMETDGTITLVLRAEAIGGATLGDARVRYELEDSDYPNILKHVGPLKPGETKPCPPWDNGGGR